MSYLIVNFTSMMEIWLWKSDAFMIFSLLPFRKKQKNHKRIRINGKTNGMNSFCFSGSSPHVKTKYDCQLVNENNSEANLCKCFHKMYTRIKTTLTDAHTRESDSYTVDKKFGIRQWIPQKCTSFL